MILGDSDTPHALPGARATLDDLFRRAGVRRPDAVALVDPPNRGTFMSGEPRRLTYAEADRAVSAIAGRLQRLGLAPDAVVGIQLPHCVESVLTLLGVLRAGMIAAPLPLLWRRAECVAALSRLGAKVLIAGGHAGADDLARLALDTAAGVFPIRYVCGFGSDLPDGVIPCDDLLTGIDRHSTPPAVRGGDNAPNHVAVVTWDVTPEGLTPVARNHMELIAAGLAMMLEARLPDSATILSTCPGGTLAGRALGVLPWLLTGGTLVLHQPFDAETFGRQCEDEGCDTVVIPGPLAARLGEAGLLSRHGLRHVLGVWRAPERVPGSGVWNHPGASLVDVLTFGESGLFAARRGEDGKPAAIPLGPVMAPRGAAGAVIVAETARTAAGTLALRGPTVPRTPYPPGTERSGLPHLKADAAGFVDTGFACRVGIDAQSLIVSAPPPGIVSVGGYRFLLRDLQTAASDAEIGAGIAALPDPLGGHRLAGQADDRDNLQALLAAAGLNPLVADAFRHRANGNAA